MTGYLYVFIVGVIGGVFGAMPFVIREHRRSIRALQESQDVPITPKTLLGTQTKPVWERKPMQNDFWNRPCAAYGLISYRAKGNFGFIMIGAKDDADAKREALRSTDKPHDLEVWDGEKYVPVVTL